MLWYFMTMKVAADRIRALCRQRGWKLTALLREAGVSRNAFYSLARRESIVPHSLRAIADRLDLPVSAMLEEEPGAADRMRAVMHQTEQIVRGGTDLEPENIRHTLVLLAEEPVDRLRRALRRGRRFDFR